MTTFRKIPVESEIAGDEPLSDYALGYLTERVRNNFYDYVLRRFHEAANEENLTKAQLAKRLGLGPDRISKILGAPGNWTLLSYWWGFAVRSWSRIQSLTSLVSQGISRWKIF